MCSILLHAHYLQRIHKNLQHLNKKSSMYCLKRFTVIFYAVTVVGCERWYSATIIADTKPEDQDNKTGFWNENRKYLPLPVIQNDNITDINTFKLHNHYLDEKPQVQSGITTEVEHLSDIISLPYDSKTDTSNVSSVRPKRKVPKCPSMRPKWKKQLNPPTKTRKFLDVFEVVQFEHVTCTSTTGLEGTCLHEYDCQNVRGSPAGACADGYGTCCIIQFVCDGSYSSPIGWFTNPGFPAASTDRISCVITLNKSSAEIKQIRLDFLNFEMLPPTSGTCEDDQFVVSGQNSNSFIPILCGINSGQHVYIEVGNVVGPVNLSVQTVTAESRLYAIKVTQISKSDDLAAPNGCLQYYKDADGYLQSFNYLDSSYIGIPRYPSYLNNLNYAICIERAAATCSITYTNAEEIQIPNYDTDRLPVIPPKQAGVEIFDCPSDWLLIAAIRLCGERLNDGSVLQDFSLDAPVTDNGAGPIIVWFRSDGGYVGRGFKLHFLQNACTLST